MMKSMSSSMFYHLQSRWYYLWSFSPRHEFHNPVNSDGQPYPFISIVFLCDWRGGKQRSQLQRALRVSVLWMQSAMAHSQSQTTPDTRITAATVVHVPFRKIPTNSFQCNSSLQLLATTCTYKIPISLHSFALCEWGHEWSYCSNVCWWCMMMMIRRSIKGPREKGHYNGDK